MSWETEKEFDVKTRKRHNQIAQDFKRLTNELEAEELFEPDPYRSVIRAFISFCMFFSGIAMLFWFTDLSIFWHATGLLMIAFGAGQSLSLGHECGHNSFTGVTKIDTILQLFNFGFVFGLSASCWNHSHAKYHTTTKYEITKNPNFKPMTLLSFNKNFETSNKSRVWIQYQKILFLFFDSFIVMLTWKFNYHVKFIVKNNCWWDLIFMVCHYSLVPILGFQNGLVISWLSSVYALGRLILSHTTMPVEQQNENQCTNLHWIEYVFLCTKNIQPFYERDWCTGVLNYQIEHRLFPTMPEFKRKFCSDKVKEFALRNGLPYQVCSFWEVFNLNNFNLESVTDQTRSM